MRILFCKRYLTQAKYRKIENPKKNHLFTKAVSIHIFTNFSYLEGDTQWIRKIVIIVNLLIT